MEQLSRRTKWAMAAIMAFSVLAIMLSIELTRIHYTVITEPEHRTSCRALGEKIEDSGKYDCNQVAYNPHSEVLGIPISLFGVGTYSLFFLGALFQLWPFHPLLRHLRNYLFLLALWCSGYSVFLFWIMLTQVKAICLYCTALHVIDLLLLLLSAASLDGPRLFFRQIYQDLQTLQKSPWVFATGTLLLLGLSSAAAVQYHRLKDRLPTISDSKGEVIDLTGDPVLGYYAAPLTIIEFSDFECPACRPMHRVMQEILKAFPGQLRLVHKNFPLSSECNPQVPVPQHPHSCTLAYAGECAAQQGKFEAYADYLFKTEEFSIMALADAAESLGMNKEQFLACLNSNETKLKVGQDIGHGMRLKVEATPTFILGNKRFSGYYDFETTKKVIEGIIAGEQPFTKAR